MAEHPDRIEVDLSGATFFCCAAVTALVDTRKATGGRCGAGLEFGDALLVVGVQRGARDRDVPFGGHGDRAVARVEVAGVPGQVEGRDLPAGRRRRVGRVHAVVDAPGDVTLDLVDDGVLGALAHGAAGDRLGGPADTAEAADTLGAAVGPS